MRKTLGLVTLYCVLISSIAAQQPQPTPSARPDDAASQPKSKDKKAQAAERVKAEARARAVEMLNELAVEARSFRDTALRARVQTRAASLLWTRDEARARALFLRAWENAEVADQESARRVEEARAAKGPKPKFVMIPATSNLRGEILREVALYDRALAVTLLVKYDLAENEARKANEAPAEAPSGTPPPPPYVDPLNPPASTARRLELAGDLLEKGEIERALSFAEGALNHTSGKGIFFLTALRQVRPNLADDLYTHLLALEARNPQADATIVSVLSSYVLSPFFYVARTRQGSSSNSVEFPQPPSAIPASIRADFFRVAAEILLRTPLPAKALAGPEGTMFTINRLLPFFERHALVYVADLKARLLALATDAPRYAERASSDSLLTAGFDEPLNSYEVVSDYAARAERASTSDVRDQTYAHAARIAARTGDARARDLVSKIADEEMRQSTTAYVDFLMLDAALTKKDVDAAMRQLRGAALLAPIQRVLALVSISRMLRATDPVRARDSLEDAVVAVRQLDAGSSERANAFAATAFAAYPLDTTKSWELASEMVQAANSATGFTGEDGRVVARIPGVDNEINMSYPEFNIRSVLELLARDDFNRAKELAESFERESPRAYAILAVAGGVLADSQPAKSKEGKPLPEKRNN